MERGLFFVLVFVMSLLSLRLAAQEEKPGVKMTGRATQRSIKLRWAPNTPTLWHFANKYGYTLERITLSENNQVLRKPIKVIINKVPLKPAAQALWEAAMDTDDNVAVAAQAIYGEEFEVVDNQSEIMKVINKAKELESRFSFALFAADQSVKAAELSALYYEDETIAPATKYLYRIYANIPEQVHKADTGFFLAGLQDYKPLPKPIDLKADFRDHLALLSWNGALFDNVYNSFWVERSADGAKTFKRISEQPIINTYSGDRPKTRLIFRTDSLPSNDVAYHYRVMGINAFGETGPPSDTVSGSGMPVFAYSASIVNHTIGNDGRVMLEYAFPKEGESLLKSFDLTRIDLKTKVTTVVKKGLEKNARSVLDESPRSSNYYVIRANDRYGRNNNSFPYLVQLEDSIPPMPPVEVTGKIDTLGHVYLNWKNNTEDDLLGYTIYRSNFNSEEFIQVPGPIWQQNAYVDTILLKNLTEKIHYKIMAVDKRFNPSRFSAVLTLEKPDLVPPVPPVFESIKSDSTGVTLSWIKSGSEDVVRHLLYRRGENESEWTLVKMFTESDTAKVYVDANVKHRILYAYTLLAVDDAGLESIPSEPLSIRWMNDNPYPEVNSIFYKIDKTKRNITLTWNYEQTDVEKFLIYRADNGEPLKLFKTIDASQRQLTDQYKVSDSNVEYRIVAGFKTGERTRISKPLVVKM
jgi:fibronectin type 3 domain-containing protein